MVDRNRKPNPKKQSESHPDDFTDVLVEYAFDFINEGVSITQKHNRLATAALAWNLSLNKKEDREKKIEETMEFLIEDMPHREAHEFVDVRNTIEDLIARKDALFPDVRIYIVSFDMLQLDTNEFRIIAETCKLT